MSFSAHWRCPSRVKFCRSLVVAGLLLALTGQVTAQDANENPAPTPRPSTFALINGKTEQAEELLIAALAKIPDSTAQATFIAERGWILYLHNKSELAAPDCARALKLSNDSSSARYLQARLWVDAGNYDRALTLLQPLADDAGTYTRETALYGLALLLRGKPEDKPAAYDAIQQSWDHRVRWFDADQNYTVYMAYGEFCLRRDQVEEAKACFDKASQESSSRPEPRQKLAATAAAASRVLPVRTELAALVGAEALAKGDFAAAAAECDAAALADPQNDAGFTRLATVHFAWAKNLLEHGDVAGARKHTFYAHNCSRATDRDATANNLYNAIDHWVAQAIEAAQFHHDHETVLTLTAEALQDNPDDQVIRRAQIDAYRELSRWPDVIRAYADACQHRRPGAGGDLFASANENGLFQTIHDRIAVLQARENQGKDVSADFSALLAAITYADSRFRSSSADLEHTMALLNAKLQHWSAAQSALDAAIRHADDRKKAEYIAERENLARLPAFARRTGKNFALAVRLQATLDPYLLAVARNPQAPVQAALEAQLPPLQRERLQTIRQQSSLRARYAARSEAAYNEAKGIVDRINRVPGTSFDASTQSDLDDAKARSRADRDQAEGLTATLQTLLEDFWRE